MRRRVLFASIAGAFLPGSSIGTAEGTAGDRLPQNGASYQLSAHLVAAFHQGLAETGYVEGRNVSFDYRSADGQYDRLPALAADLVRRQVTVIVATGTPDGAAGEKRDDDHSDRLCDRQRSCRPRTRCQPEPDPGGTLTGATTLAVEVGQKRMELLHDLIPSATQIGVLFESDRPQFGSRHARPGDCGARRRVVAPCLAGEHGA